MANATLIQSPSGFTIEFHGAVTGRPTWDVQAIAAMLATLGIRNLDLRINEELDELELLIQYGDVLNALRRYRKGTTPTEAARAIASF